MIDEVNDKDLSTIKISYYFWNIVCYFDFWSWEVKKNFESLYLTIYSIFIFIFSIFCVLNLTKNLNKTKFIIDTKKNTLLFDLNNKNKLQTQTKTLLEKVWNNNVVTFKYFIQCLCCIILSILHILEPFVISFIEKKCILGYIIFKNLLFSTSWILILM